MRRLDLINGLRKIAEDLIDADIASILRNAIARSSDKDKTGFDIEGYTRFAINASKYSSTDVEIIGRLGLQALLSADFWQVVMTTPSQEMMLTIYHSIDQAITVIPKVVDLLERDYKEGDEVDVRSKSVLHGKLVFTIILPEETNQFSSPQRVIEAIGAVSTFYNVIAQLEGFDGNDLTIVGCDSGSDKSFDFLGVASLVQHLRGLVSDIWDRVLLGRQQQMGANIGLITQSLPVIEKIESMAAAGTLGREECEILKRNLLDGVSRFLDAGVITGNMVPQGNRTPRTLMQPQTRLLAAPEVHERPARAVEQNDSIIAEADAANSDKPLSSAETVLLRKLFERANMSQSPADKTSPPKRTRRPVAKKSQKPETNK